MEVELRAGRLHHLPQLLAAATSVTRASTIAAGPLHRRHHAPAAVRLKPVAPRSGLCRPPHRPRRSKDAGGGLATVARRVRGGTATATRSKEAACRWERWSRKRPRGLIRGERGPGHGRTADSAVSPEPPSGACAGLARRWRRQPNTEPCTAEAWLAPGSPTKQPLTFLGEITVPVSSYIIKESLKLKSSDAETVVNIHGASEKFAELILLLESNDDVGTLKEKLEDEYLKIPTDSLKRVFAGLILREIKDFWWVLLLISVLTYPEAGNAADNLNKQDELHLREEKYSRVEHGITDLDLDGVWKLKPVLDRKSIMGVLQVKSGGPLIGQWQQRSLKWQLAHPDRTMDDCIEWMKQSQSKRQKIETSA